MNDQLKAELTQLLADQLRDLEDRDPTWGTWSDIAEYAMDFFYGEPQDAPENEADLGQDSGGDGGGTACCGGFCNFDGPDDSGDPVPLLPMMVEIPTERVTELTGVVLPPGYSVVYDLDPLSPTEALGLLRESGSAESAPSPQPPAPEDERK